MKRIESFCVNHDKLKPGMYVSRIDGDAVTYDIRMVVPNAGVYLENDGLHTFEHLFATYVRNSADSDNIIYVGPMGCRTGFYLLTADLTCKEVFSALKAALKAALAMDEVPGSAREECGNYLEHDLADAKRECSLYLALLNSLTDDDIAAQETKRQEEHA